MTGPIHPDRFDQLCEDSRRLRFLEAYVKNYGRLTISSADANETLSGAIDKFMLKHPELIEERTEVQAKWLNIPST